jgi:hypothetical protein
VNDTVGSIPELLRDSERPSSAVTARASGPPRPHAIRERRTPRGRHVTGGHPAIRAAPRDVAGYGVSRLIRVYQLASAVRVLPQLPTGGSRYCSSVQVCPMYSDAIQMLEPSGTAAP